MLFSKVFHRRFLTLIIFTLLIPIFSSCSVNRVLGLKKEEFKNKVSQKDYNFIKEVDYLRNSIKEINRLGDGASYYMSFVYKNCDMLLFSNKLLYQEIQNKDSYYGPKAATQLVKQLLEQKKYVKAETNARAYFKKYKIENHQVRKQLVEAMYWQKKDELVIEYINNLDRTKYSDYANSELDLLKTVSSARLNLDDWEEEYKNLFFDQPLSPILTRAYSFISVFPDYAKGFSASEIEYFKALSVASKGNTFKAQKILKPILYNEDWVFSTVQSVKNASKIIKNSRVVSANIGAFKTAYLNAPGNIKQQALTSYASLYFNVGRYSVVSSLLGNKIKSMEVGTAKDDAIWLYILSLSHVGVNRVVSDLNIYIDMLSGENYHSDIIDHVITALVQKEEWEAILELDPIVQKHASTHVKSRATWILARLYFYDFLKSNNSETVVTNKLKHIVATDNYSYYSYISNALLKQDANLTLAEPKAPTELTKDDHWIQGFVDYGLEEEALTYFKQVDDLNYSVALTLANKLDKSDKHLENLRFLNQAKVPLNKETFPLYYPLPYKDKIVEIANRYDFPYTLYSGLIRTESGFDMDVVSIAGAVGLSQLMPATAKEQAFNIGIKNPDLNDPDTNITLGGSYLNWLIGKYGTLPLSCMAYNAGPGNVWKWQKGWGGLPDELFIEAAPFKETRAYVPKILRAAIYYGHEEFDLAPYSVVKQIFPNIDKS